MSTSAETMEPISLSSGTIPTFEKLSDAYNLAIQQPTILVRDCARYLEVISLYPLGSNIPEFDEIAEAAAIGDPLGVIYEWLLIIREINMVGFDTDATWTPDLPRDREEAVQQWETVRGYRKAKDNCPEPTETIAETLEVIDEPLRVIAGILAIDRMEKSIP